MTTNERNKINKRNVFKFSEIPNFLSADECAHFIKMAQDVGMVKSPTASPNVEKKPFRLMDLDADKRLTVSEVMEYTSFLTSFLLY